MGAAIWKLRCSAIYEGRKLVPLRMVGVARVLVEYMVRVFRSNEEDTAQEHLFLSPVSERSCSCRSRSHLKLNVDR